MDGFFVVGGTGGTTEGAAGALMDGSGGAVEGAAWSVA